MNYPEHAALTGIMTPKCTSAVGIPNGCVPPFAFGISTRPTGGGKYATLVTHDPFTEYVHLPKGDVVRHFCTLVDAAWRVRTIAACFAAVERIAHIERHS